MLSMLMTRSRSQYCIIIAQPIHEQTQDTSKALEKLGESVKQVKKEQQDISKQHAVQKVAKTLEKLQENGKQLGSTAWSLMPALAAINACQT